MRILLVNSVCGIGSTGKICVDIYKELKNRGHECCIAYGRGTADNGIFSYKISNKTSIYLDVLNTRLFSNDGLGSKKETYKFIKFIKSFHPDVIHLHNIHGYYLNYQILFDFLSKSDIKIIWTLHDCWSFSGLSAYIDFDSNRKLVDTKHGVWGTSEYPKMFFNRSKRNLKLKKQAFSSIKSMKIITPSNWLKEMVENSFFNKYSIETIHNGIDLRKFQYDFSLKNKSKVKVLSVANIWEKRKGLNDVQIIAKQNPDIEFTVIGKIPDKKITLPENIFHIDQTNSIEELSVYYNKASIFLNPTYFDNFPTTNIESLACGTPVITYDTGGSSEALTDKTGYVFNQGDIQSINYLLKNFISKEFISNECRKSANFFSKEQMIDEYLNIYMSN